MNSSILSKSDFCKVKDLKFDILKLREALKQVLSKKEYDDAAGTKYIAGISLNQIRLALLASFPELSGLVQ